MYLWNLDRIVVIASWIRYTTRKSFTSILNSIRDLTTLLPNYICYSWYWLLDIATCLAIFILLGYWSISKPFEAIQEQGCQIVNWIKNRNDLLLNRESYRIVNRNDSVKILKMYWEVSLRIHLEKIQCN